MMAAGRVGMFRVYCSSSFCPVGVDLRLDALLGGVERGREQRGAELVGQRAGGRDKSSGVATRGDPCVTGRSEPAVKLLERRRGQAYPDMAREPEAAFAAVAQ